MFLLHTMYNLMMRLRMYMIQLDTECMNQHLHLNNDQQDKVYSYLLLMMNTFHWDKLNNLKIQDLVGIFLQDKRYKNHCFHYYMFLENIVYNLHFPRLNMFLLDIYYMLDLQSYYIFLQDKQYMMKLTLLSTDQLDILYIVHFQLLNMFPLYNYNKLLNQYLKIYQLHKLNMMYFH
jgi:hypothetical protein